MLNRGLLRRAPWISVLLFMALLPAPGSLSWQFAQQQWMQSSQKPLGGMRVLPSLRGGGSGSAIEDAAAEHSFQMSRYDSGMKMDSKGSAAEREMKRTSMRRVKVGVLHDAVMAIAEMDITRLFHLPVSSQYFLFFDLCIKIATMNSLLPFSSPESPMIDCLQNALLMYRFPALGPGRCTSAGLFPHSARGCAKRQEETACVHKAREIHTHQAARRAAEDGNRVAACSCVGGER